MQPGLGKIPFGARALYIYQDGKDNALPHPTVLRNWWSDRPRRSSSGCAAHDHNQDVIDLYDRVPEQSPDRRARRFRASPEAPFYLSVSGSPAGHARSRGRRRIRPDLNEQT